MAPLDQRVTHVHVNAARQTRIEAPDGPHDVDAFEGVETALFEDRLPLYGVFVGSGRAVTVAGARIPWRRRVRMVVGDFLVADHDVVGQHPADRFGESTSD